MSVNIFITGRPGSGKSTLAREVAEELKSESDIEYGGISTPDFRENRKRKGFKIVDLLTGEKAVMASVDKKGQRIGKYGVDVQAVERIGMKAVEKALRTADLVVIDEIGPMELLSGRFKMTVDRVVRSDKPLLAVVHRRMVDDYKDKGKVFRVSRERFESVKKIIKKKLKEEI